MFFAVAPSKSVTLTFPFQSKVGDLEDDLQRLSAEKDE